MKTQRKTLPPCYKQQFSKRDNEWVVKKSFYFTDINGKKHRSDTKWHKTIQECEIEASLVIESNGTVKGNKNNNEPTIGSTLEDYVKYLEKEAKKPTAYKNTSAYTRFKDTSALLNLYTPAKIKDTKIKGLKSSTFADWITYINSDTSDHQELSGVRVRAFRTAIKSYITKYLVSNILIEREQGFTFRLAVDDVALKPKKTGKRNNRNNITFNDLQTIKKYYSDKGLEKFENFYWYCFYTILFCTGMRVGEIIALRWCDVQFSTKPENNIIHIRNSIGEKELVENVLERIKLNNLEAKNKYSIRDITMWAYYRDLLRDFKHASMWHFGLMNPSEMREMFVFPNLSPSTRPYRTQKSTLTHTNNLMEKLGLPKTDNQMFRHACAYYLAYEQGFPIEKSFSYFGHCDSDMIREVYAPLNVEERRINVSRTLNSLITDETMVFESITSEVNVKAGEELKKEQNASRKKREYGQILRAIEKGQKLYGYPEYLDDLIEEIIKEHKEILYKIQFAIIMNGQEDWTC